MPVTIQHVDSLICSIRVRAFLTFSNFQFYIFNYQLSVFACVCMCLRVSMSVRAVLVVGCFLVFFFFSFFNRLADWGFHVNDGSDYFFLSLYLFFLIKKKNCFVGSRAHSSDFSHKWRGLRTDKNQWFSCEIEAIHSLLSIAVLSPPLANVWFFLVPRSRHWDGRRSFVPSFFFIFFKSIFSRAHSNLETYIRNQDSLTLSLALCLFVYMRYHNHYHYHHHY